MSREAYLVAKAERDTRSTLEKIPKVEVALIKQPKQKYKRDRHQTERVAVGGGAAGAALVLTGRAVVGPAVGHAGKKAWNSDAKRRLIAWLRRVR